MAADMDIEMDLDVALTAEDMAIPNIEIMPETEQSSTQHTSILSGPNDTSDTNSFEPTPQKVHIRGLDNFTTNDIRAWAAEYWEAHRPSRIEWIDDNSANMVYESAEIAGEALVALTGTTIESLSQMAALETIAAKRSTLHPSSNLEARLAVFGDRKAPRAREKSRFYLMHPEHDPAERRKRSEHTSNRRYRDREDGGYRSQRYDDREQQRRQDEDADAGFEADLYDDDETALTRRAERHGRLDSSLNGPRGRESRQVRFEGNAGKELFSDHGSGKGRLRNRSASPTKDADDREPHIAKRRKQENATAAANRQKAQLIKATLLEASSPRELFPTKAVHRRSGAFDAADETADLFSSHMPVPFVDGSSDRRPANGSLGSRMTSRNSNSGDSTFSIRGTAKTQPTQSFNIKGAASVRELFPATLGENSGKELFSDRLEGRGQRRQKAEDLFH